LWEFRDSQIRVVVGLVSLSCPWLVLAPKVLQLCTSHFVLVLCRFAWIVEACQFFLVPSQSSNMPLYPSKVLQTRELAPSLYSSIVFNLDSHLSPSRSWECVIALFMVVLVLKWNKRLNITFIYGSCFHTSYFLIRM
jgi:hypothetical protein